MRIGIVNDVAMAREALRRVVLSSPKHEIAWSATDGEEAVTMARDDRPDLILMDLFMPGVDGVEATRQIMSESPCAILLVTATVTGHLSMVYRAMGHGALDAIDTPTTGMHGDIPATHLLLNKIEMIGKLIVKPIPDGPDEATSLPSHAADVVVEAGLHPLVVLGASTGGPNALLKLIAGLPATLGAGIIIAQHLDSAFCEGLRGWLAEGTQREVTLIAEGSVPRAGEILLTGTDDHVLLGGDRRLHYSIEPRTNYYRPSVDVLFDSVARNWPTPGVAAILTGIGRDGAKGLLHLRQQGWWTIAQDVNSSVVSDMPRSAAEIGAAQEILPLPLIAEAISRRIAAQT